MRSGHKLIYAILSGPEVQVCFIQREDILMKEVVKEKVCTEHKEVEVVEPSLFGNHGKLRKRSRSSNNVVSFNVF